MTTLTEDQIAAQLFPSMVKEPAKQQPTQQQQAPAPEQQQQQSGGDPVQEHALKELKIANDMYGEMAYSTIKLVEPDEDLSRSAEDIAEENAAHRDDLWAIQASDVHAKQLTDMLRGAAKNPISEEVQAQQLRDAQAQLVARYGESGARERMGLVQKLLARSPRLAERIAKAGLANEPHIVEAAHELAWSQRAKGLL